MVDLTKTPFNINALVLIDVCRKCPYKQLSYYPPIFISLNILRTLKQNDNLHMIYVLKNVMYKDTSTTNIITGVEPYQLKTNYKILLTFEVLQVFSSNENLPNNQSN